MRHALRAPLLLLVACGSSPGATEEETSVATIEPRTGTVAGDDTTRAAAHSEPSSCVPATPDDILTRKGDYYRCIDTTLLDGSGCGTGGYPLGFGAKYADRSFDETWFELTPAGQAFFLAVSPCLQVRLATELTAASSCEAVWNDGFATHTGCYVDSGFCELPAADLFVIGTMFDADVYLMDEFNTQVADVSLACDWL